MKAKEKAIELVKKCSRYACMGRFECKYHRHENAKELALITVNEMLSECRIQSEWYWKEVKQEILAL